MENREQLFCDRLSEFFEMFKCSKNPEKSFGEILFEFIEFYKRHEPVLKILFEPAEEEEGGQPKEQLFHRRLSEFFEHFKRLNSEKSFGKILFEFIEWYKRYEPLFKFLFVEQAEEDTIANLKKLVKTFS